MLPLLAVLVAALLALPARGADGEKRMNGAALTDAPAPQSEEVATAFTCAGAGQPVAGARPVPLTSELAALRTLYLQGRCEERAGHLQAARRNYEAGLAEEGVPTILLRLALLRVELAAGDHPAAVSSLIALLQQQPGDTVRDRVRELLAPRLAGPQALEPELLYEYLTAYLAYAEPQPEDGPLLERLLALAQRFRDDALLRGLPVRLWRQPADEEAAIRWAGVPDAQQPDGPYGVPPAAYLERARRLYELRLFQRLADELEAAGLPQMAPEEAKALGRLYFRALIRERRLSHAVVQAHTDGFVERFAFSRRQTLIWRIRLQLRRNKVGPALKLLEELEQVSPEDEELPYLFYLVADYNRRRGNTVTLAYWCERIVKRFPGTQEASDAYWMMTWQAFSDGDTAVMNEWLERAMAASEGFHPVDRARLWYWRGRLQRDGGQEAAAQTTWANLRDRWPYGYYAALSEQMASGDPLRFAGGGIGLDGALPPQPGIDHLWGIEPFPRALFLYAVGEPDMAQDLLGDAVARPMSDEAVEEASALFFHQGQHYLQLRLLANHRLDDLRNSRPGPGSLWRRAFPRPHWPTVRAEAERAGVDPYFVLAVMREESRFYTVADSRVGARGLMQLMPATAAMMARLRGIEFDAAHLNLPEMNIPLGTQYLKRVLGRFDDNPVYAAAAYNAGPSRLKRWLRDFGDLPLDAFVESIPFTETQNYVKRVFLSYWVYTKLYR